MRQPFEVRHATAALLGAAVASKIAALLHHRVSVDAIGIAGWFGEDAAIVLLFAVLLVVTIGPLRRHAPRWPRATGRMRAC